MDDDHGLAGECDGVVHGNHRSSRLLWASWSNRGVAATVAVVGEDVRHSYIGRSCFAGCEEVAQTSR